MLSLEVQILQTFTYWRKDRTLQNISMDLGIDESSASRIIRKVGYIMIDSVEFGLPKKIFDRQW